MKYKIILAITSIFIICCNSNKKNDKQKSVKDKSIKIDSIHSISEKKIISPNLTFNETRDSLRTLLLDSKPNENLKSSILKELYIRGLVNKIKDRIIFELRFNLHEFDCGAPDCYSTDITFDIKDSKPIKFPKFINFELREHGCYIENEIKVKGVFELVEKSSKYVNYYSKKQKSNLIIIGETNELYYFTDTKPESIKVKLIKKLFEEYNEEKPTFTVPYQSTIMNADYEYYLDN